MGSTVQLCAALVNIHCPKVPDVQFCTELYYIGHMKVSPVHPTLGTRMRERRAALELSQSGAAKAAKVSRNSWIGWENGTTTPEQYNFPKIERALRWAPGSVEATLDGGDPTELAEATVSPLPARGNDLPPDDDFVRELRATPGISPEYLDVLIHAYWADRAVEQQRIEDKWRGIARSAGTGA